MKLMVPTSKTVKIYTHIFLWEGGKKGYINKQNITKY